jgi:hypothetical protein
MVSHRCYAQVKEKWAEVTDFTNPDHIIDFTKEFDAVVRQLRASDPERIAKAT